MVAVYSRADDFMGLHTVQPHPGRAAWAWFSFQPQPAALCSPYLERGTMEASGANIRAVLKISPHPSGQGEKMIWMGGDILDTPKSLLQNRNPACSCAWGTSLPRILPGKYFASIQHPVYPCVPLLQTFSITNASPLPNAEPSSQVSLSLLFLGDQMICILMGEEERG